MKFEHSSGWFPMAVVATAREKDLALLVHDDGRHADGVLRTDRHQVPFGWVGSVGNLCIPPDEAP